MKKNFVLFRFRVFVINKSINIKSAKNYYRD